MPTKLLIVRHAIAENKETFALSGEGDELRPLTSRGRKKMRKNLIGIKGICPHLDEIITSPLTRAVETAKIIRKEYPKAKVVAYDELKPGSKMAPLLEILRQYKKKEAIAVVGHEPHLSQLVSFLVMNRQRSCVTFKKGAVCLLEFRDKIDKGCATLVYLLQPLALRKMVNAKDASH